MSPGEYSLGDYIEVKDRIIEFRQKYPDGSLSSEVILWPTADLPFLAVKSYAHRSRKDESPGTGMAWEPYPGKTRFTKDSELQNAETSAVGRAIVFALAADARLGIASADEIRNRRPEPSPSPQTARGSGPEGASASPVEAPSQTVAGGGEQEALVGEGRTSDAPPPVTLAETVALYGGRAHLLRAARQQWDVLSLDDLSEPMLAELKRVKVA